MKKKNYLSYNRKIDAYSRRFNADNTFISTYNSINI